GLDRGKRAPNGLEKCAPVGRLVIFPTDMLGVERIAQRLVRRSETRIRITGIARRRIFAGKRDEAGRRSARGIATPRRLARIIDDGLGRADRRIAANQILMTGKTAAALRLERVVREHV